MQQRHHFLGFVTEQPLVLGSVSEELAHLLITEVDVIDKHHHSLWVLLLLLPRHPLLQSPCYTLRPCTWVYADPKQILGFGISLEDFLDGVGEGSGLACHVFSTPKDVLTVKEGPQVDVLIEAVAESRDVDFSKVS